MKRSGIQPRGGQAAEPTRTVRVELSAQVVETLTDVEHGLLGLCIEVGQQVLTQLMEEDRIALCGPKWQPDPARSAVRAGTTRSEVTLGGRRITIQRPRVRARTNTEIALPTFTAASARDPLNRQTLAAVVTGVATRRYARGLEPLPASLTERATSKSAVSRRFTVLSRRLLTQWLARSLEEVELVAVLIDGIVFRSRCLVVALGITANGDKRVLGLRQGSTENATLVRELLRDMVDRGMRTDRALLFVIDGSKALRAGIEQLFGSLALIQRCQVHKRRNVRDHLPEAVRPRIARALHQAYNAPTAADAHRQLERLATSLEREHPSAAASLREGLDETLTVCRLGITGKLYQTLRSTNSIESLNATIVAFVRNVRLWRNGDMLLRWAATALKEAEPGFHRVRGCQDIRDLVAALQQHQQRIQMDTTQQVA
jgi:transposase-like protein